MKTFVARQADAIFVTGFTHTPACERQRDIVVSYGWHYKPGLINGATGILSGSCAVYR